MKNTLWLKEQIWSTHESFEYQSSFVKKLRTNDVSIQHYTIFLKSIYFIVKEVENSAKQYWDLDFGFLKDLEDELSKLPNINVDNKSTIKFDSKYEILGTIYTLNGSMKGGIHIKNILNKNPQFENYTFKYYKQRDEISNWIENMIDNTIFNDEEKNKLVKGAKSIFEALNKN